MRIKDLGNTATDFANDDYLVIDGTTNGSRKISKNTLLEKSAQNALYSFFDEFSELKSYDYGDKVRYGNKFYFFKVHKNAGAWSSAYVEEFNMAELVVELKKTLNSKACYWGDELVLANVNKGIVTNGGVGSVVDLTPVSHSGCSCGVFDCSEGDVFKLVGTGYSAYRLWCFIDENDKIISSCYASAVVPSSDPLVVLAPKGAVKVVINVSTVGKSVVKCESIVSVVGSLVDGIVKARRELSLYEYVTDFVKGYISTNGAIGSVVSYVVTAQSNFRSVVIDCSKGDIFKYEGTGGANGRLWCFVDSDDKIVSHAVASYVSDGVEYIEAPADGKAIFNFVKNSSSDVVYLGYCSGNDTIFHKVVAELKQKDVESDMSLYSLSSYYGDGLLASMPQNKGIVTNGGVGSVVDYTPVSHSGCVYYLTECKKGDVFKIRGVGYSAYRLWCFTDSSDKIVDVAADTESTNGEFIYKVAPCDGHFICNQQFVSVRALYKRGDVDSAIKTNESNIDYLTNKVPFVRLDLDRAPYDPTSLLSGFNFTDYTNYTSNIYALFNALALASNGVITSFDVGDYCGETYPAYAGSEKVICYKISCSSAYWGNTRKFTKKKILITGGVHGNEKAAPFNLYIFAWRLINDIAHEDLFSLLSAFDFYIIPCVNLYGLKNDTRWNGNGVDINRNSNTTGWVVNGTPFTPTYTGPSADSEFETKCIHKCLTDLGIDWYIDHHNYADDRQFYTETSDKRIFLRSYDAIKEISEFCIKNQPSSFGSVFTMVNNDEYTSACPIGLNQTIGQLEVWANQNGFLSCTIEINEVIGYVSGIPSFSYDNDRFGHNTFSVGEFTLRCQLILYGEILMDKVYS